MTWLCCQQNSCFGSEAGRKFGCQCAPVVFGPGMPVRYLFYPFKALRTFALCCSHGHLGPVKAGHCRPTLSGLLEVLPQHDLAVSSFTTHHSTAGKKTPKDLTIPLYNGLYQFSQSKTSHCTQDAETACHPGLERTHRNRNPRKSKLAAMKPWSPLRLCHPGHVEADAARHPHRLVQSQAPNPEQDSCSCASS